jgi:hypothetical protein
LCGRFSATKIYTAQSSIKFMRQRHRHRHCHCLCIPLKNGIAASVEPLRCAEATSSNRIVYKALNKNPWISLTIL